MRFIAHRDNDMSATITKLLILILLMPWAAYAAEPESLGSKADILTYRCNIVSVYNRLHELSFQYGSILINEDEKVIYHASKEAVRAFDDIRGELESILVPGDMNESHQILVRSVNSYTQSARNIERALGIFIGEYQGEEKETLELLDNSEAQAELGNKYLAESLKMHENLFVMDGEVSKSCKKYVASVSY